MHKISNHTIRRILFPTELVRQVRRVCQAQKCTFSDFALEAVKRALANITADFDGKE
ncbi:MAG: hypothetical protein IKU51_02100 [Clostridia bacterium]|nr:hypothetical protein [Clostridia bacterium]